ncbi:AAA family ATPase [Nonlabens xiamenensis]|uniref:AAA family ATPase n=1 Tax=Nonlabens xiamenensis TaxID=2341043 RepID=UPI000F60F94E|nr:AAA family ATPase [Nonlabens xiamenensis]
MKSTKQRWLRDFIRFLPLKSQFVLSGNTKDLQLLLNESDSFGWHTLEEVIDAELKNYGYRHVVYYNPLQGFSVPFYQGTPEEKEELYKRLGIPLTKETVYNNLPNFDKVLKNIVECRDFPVALVIDFASQFLMNPESLLKVEHDTFGQAHVLSQKTTTQPFGSPSKAFYNTVIWVVDKEGDLPDWMIINNPKIRHIPIGRPDHYSRRRLVTPMIHGMLNDQDKTTQVIQDFVDETEGLLLLDLVAILELARSESIPIVDIADAVRRYKLGVTEDPWMNIDRLKIEHAEEFIKSRVKGQDHSIQHLIDIVKRAITGVGSSKRNNRPRGVVFLAGPTGVGKTELAKTVTSLLFGDESSYIRFDMSEFSAEHASQRLIGAPPGYVGYDVGGELTNAVREKPFSVVLFDEIEKAHPRILDKFLQILDDGVLTSGRGDKVYFSETLIVFTSNLGIYKETLTGERVPNVNYNDTFDVVEAKVKEEIDRYFKFDLNRPELLNRIGENVIVFDYIRKDVGELIFDMMIDDHIRAIEEQLEIRLKLDSNVRNQLKELAVADLSNGGRGVRNMIEYHFITPISRALFSLNPSKGEVVNATEVFNKNRSTHIKLQRS